MDLASSGDISAPGAGVASRSEGAAEADSSAEAGDSHEGRFPPEAPSMVDELKSGGISSAAISVLYWYCLCLSGNQPSMVLQPVSKASAKEAASNGRWP
jgi:hypothetical protein